MGSRLKQCRKELGLGTVKFGELLDISQSAVSAIENDKGLPSGHAIINLLKNTNVSADWFLAGRGFPYRRIGERLRTARESRHMKVSELSQRTGLDADVILAAESERAEIDDALVASIASETQTDLHWLRTGYDHEGNLTSLIHLPAKGAAAPWLESQAQPVILQESSFVYQANHNPTVLANAVRVAYVMLDEEEVKRNILIHRDYKGLVVGLLADCVLRKAPATEIKETLEQLIGNLPPKPKRQD